MDRNSLQLRSTDWLNKNVGLTSSWMLIGNGLEMHTEPTAKVFNE